MEVFLLIALITLFSSGFKNQVKPNAMFTSAFPKLHGILNKKRYEMLLRKAKKKGLEEEFLNEWNIQTNNLPFPKQTGFEAMYAFRITILNSKHLRLK
ncbi:hypothetical protein R4575_16790 [Acinetobacter baumannii]|nr:hypothetical protein [Acinetobacter baumannii]